MTTKNKLLSVLSDAEQEALYGLPDFDDAQRLEYLALTETELTLASSRPGLHAKVYCLLQIGYFKAKHAFFRFDWSEVEDDCAFVLSRYFHGEVFERKPITKHEHYTQRERVAQLFGYQLWAADFLPRLEQQDDAAKAALAKLLVRDDTLSQLAALKQDAKSFGWRQMIREREKRALLEPLHRIAKAGLGVQPLIL